MAKVVTGKVRLSYVNIKTPKSFDGSDPKYSVCVMVPKSDKETLAKISKAMDAVMDEGAATWGGKVPKNLKLPLRDGDEEREDDPAFKGMMFFNASSKRQPGCIDRQKDEIFDLDEIYSGCWARVSVNFYPFSVSGNRGIAAGLNFIQKWADGPRLGGDYGSADDFDDDFDDDDYDDELM